MEITADDIINFVIANGDDFSVKLKDIEFVGIDQAINWANAQFDANLNAFNSKDDALAMFFAESFDTLYDSVYAGR